MFLHKRGVKYQNNGFLCGFCGFLGEKTSLFVPF